MQCTPAIHVLSGDKMLTRDCFNSLWYYGSIQRAVQLLIKQPPPVTITGEMHEKLINMCLYMATSWTKQHMHAHMQQKQQLGFRYVMNGCDRGAIEHFYVVILACSSVSRCADSMVTVCGDSQPLHYLIRSSGCTTDAGTHNWSRRRKEPSNADLPLPPTGAG